MALIEDAGGTGDDSGAPTGDQTQLPAKNAKKVFILASEMVADHSKDLADLCTDAGIQYVIVLASIHDAREAEYVHLPMLSGVIKRPWRQSRLLQELRNVLDPSQRRPVTVRLTTTRSLKRAGDDPIEEEDNGPVKALLVEDNRVNQKIASIMLTKLGFTVDVAGNGREAVARCDQEQYAIILMDCQMPEMDGFQATRAIRAGKSANVETPIIALTANAMTGDRERCVDAGMSDYLSKPITQERMREAVERWLGQVHVNAA